MSNEITQEQVVKIVEWLGAVYSSTSKSIMHHKDWDLGKDYYQIYHWLSSPKGEVAMMDKLEKTHQIFWDSQRGRLDIIPYEQKDEMDFICKARQDTRNQALKLAILEMLEGE